MLDPTSERSSSLNLSSFKIGEIYKIEADAVDATFQVVNDGVMPVVIIHGNVSAYMDHDGNGPSIIQLIGWTVFPEGMFESGEGFHLFELDVQPAMGWLVAVRVAFDSSLTPDFLLLAIDPVFTRIEN